jgi:hypothetical protein
MWLLNAIAVAAAAMLSNPPARLIIDTDMSGDCDDVGAQPTAVPVGALSYISATQQGWA